MHRASKIQSVLCRAVQLFEPSLVVLEIVDVLAKPIRRGRKRFTNGGEKRPALPVFETIPPPEIVDFQFMFEESDGRSSALPGSRRSSRQLRFNRFETGKKQLFKGSVIDLFQFAYDFAAFPQQPKVGIFLKGFS